MEIQYLKNLENSPIKGSSITPEDIGETEENILMLEEKMNIPLPKALKEFLFLAGDYCVSIRANALNQGLEDYEFRHEQFQEMIDWSKAPISRETYCLTEVNGQEFNFIYLSEGENPAVYNLYAKDESEHILEKKSNSFSEWIDQEIAIRLKNQNS